MITHCICYNISFIDILKKLEHENLENLNICNKCRMCNPYIEESIKTGIVKFPINYFKQYDKIKKNELES